MNIQIKVFGENDELLETAGCGNFESATEQLGKMERRYNDEQKSPIRENHEVNESEQESKSERDLEMINNL